MLRLQTMLEEGVVLTLRFERHLAGATQYPVCKLQIDDDSDGDPVGLVATLGLDEMESIGLSLLKHADQARLEMRQQDAGARWGSGMAAQIDAVKADVERLRRQWGLESPKEAPVSMTNAEDRGSPQGTEQEQ